MDRKFRLSFLLLFIGIACRAQEKFDLRNAHPEGRWFGITTFDMLFSNGEFRSDGTDWNPETRFAPVFNMQWQKHYNRKRIGCYTGFGIRNIGFHHTLGRDTSDGLSFKQRSYSMNLPVALKIGSMEKGRFFALGAEAHFLFHYKSKIEEGGEKTKYSEWFSSRMNPWNLSLFSDLRFNNGMYFRVNVFLDDWLSRQPYDLVLPSSGAVLPVMAEKSSLVYLSFGTALKAKKKQPLTRKDV